MTEPSNDLVREVLSGNNRELALLAARGVVPLSPEELLSTQIALATGEDLELAAQAAESIAETEPRWLAGFIAEAADGRALAYIAGRLRNPAVVEAILRRRDVSPLLLMQIAPTLQDDLQELLLLRQDAIVGVPAILEALETNPQLSTFSRRRIKEYREHLIPKTKAAPAPSEEPKGKDPEKDAISTEELLSEIEQVRAQPPKGELEETSGLSESQIRNLSVAARINLARGANRSLRTLLVRDPNPRVAVAVLKMNSVSDQEVEQICHNRSICEEVFEEVARRRGLTNKYPIVVALVGNPRTPVGIAVRLVPRLGMRDLKGLRRNRNVSNAVRSTAARLYTIKNR